MFITPERNQEPIDRRLSFEKTAKKADLRPKFRYHVGPLTAALLPRPGASNTCDANQLAGHKSYSTTLRYAHRSPDHRKRAVEKVQF